MRQRGYFILALVFALLAAGAVYLYLGQLEEKVKGDLEYATVIVSREYIPEGTVVTKEMLTTEEVPLGQVRQDAFQDRDEIVGMVTKTPFYPGEQFLSQKLANVGEVNDGLAYAISAGKRAVAIAVNEVVAVGNMLLPGDRVDVVAVLEEVEEDKRIPYAILFAEDLRVLAVGQALRPDQKGTTPPSTVTLEVSPAEAQKLVLAAERGSIRLILRGATDSARVGVSSFKLDDFRR